jgi:polyhydroxyalkanoate synthesis regulator phasin
MKQQTLEWINAILHNDEVSTDQELVEHFVKEGNLTEDEAKRFVAQRDKCLGINGHSFQESLFYRAS